MINFGNVSLFFVSSLFLWFIKEYENVHNYMQSKTFKVIYLIESYLENLKMKPYYPSFILANFAFQRFPQPLSCLPFLFKFNDGHKEQKRSF